MAKDFTGIEIKKGDIVAKACVSRRSPYLSACLVTDVDEYGMVYLDSFKKAIILTERLVIIKAKQEVAE